MLGNLFALFGFVILLDVGFCATTEYTVHIGTQATIIGHEYDASPNPSGRMFAGIPYAQPMTGANRFEPTQRKDPSGQMTAFNYGPECLQKNAPGSSEDCLFLNIFTPKVDNMPQQKFPVYIFIHDGGYQVGSGNWRYANYDMFKKMVSAGFFSSRDSVIPGNMGLMDQIEAINWVKRYISYFGGDPDTITVGGQSAGSMSVSLLTMSPLSQISSGVLSNQSTTYLNRFTRQSETDGVKNSDLLIYYNNSQLVAQAMQTAYIDSSNLSDQDHIGWAKEHIQIYTEQQFIGPTYRDVNFYRQTNSSVYLYSFDYLAPGALPTLDPRLRDSAVGHGWEMQYVYGKPGHSDGGWHVTSDDTDTEINCANFWTNFIKFGNPTPSPAAIMWPQLGANMEYMKLGPTPTPSTGFHPKSKFFACTVPAIEGVSQSWCS